MGLRLTLVGFLVMGLGCKSGGDATGDGGSGGDAGSVCGNGVVDDGETCDGDCGSCDDGNACTLDTQTGSAETCDLACTREVITSCASGDGCCPAGCNNASDSDCSASCGDNNIDANETCDPPGSCPTACNDGDTCTNDLMTGSSANCNAQCATSDITACVNGDMCCPSGCNSTNDSDCSVSCGNGVVEAGETCDPQGSCPTSCNDNDACTMNVLSGSSTTCNVACTYPAITTCTNGDGCCATGCTYANDNDCPPPPSTPLPDRLVTSNITAPAGVLGAGGEGSGGAPLGSNHYRVWGSWFGTLGIARVYTAPLAGCGTLVGYTTGTTSSYRARVAVLDAQDTLVTTHDLGAFVLRGLAAEPGGHWAALLWQPDAQNTNNGQIHVRRYMATGAQVWSTTLSEANSAPTDFGIGESRLEFGNNRYGAYFHVHGTAGNANGHEGEALHWIALDGTTTDGFSSGSLGNWGCSHSMSAMLRYSAAANVTLPICATDCFPGTVTDMNTNPFALTSIGGIYLRNTTSSSWVKVRDVNAACDGKIAAELGSAAPGAAGWKLVFNAHQSNATLGQSSYNTNTMNQDIGFVSVANNLGVSATVWLTTTSSTNEANSSVARWQPMGDTIEQYVVGWTSTPAGGTYYLSRVNSTGGILEGPTAITTAKWGLRDDPFRTHKNGDIVWAWFDTAGSTTLRFARLLSGNSCTP